MMADSMADRGASARAMRVEENGFCFACGPDNPIGLRLQFRPCNGGLETTFTPLALHQGLAGSVHNGLLALLLDETMAQLLYQRGVAALTCALEVSFHQQTPVGEPLRICAILRNARKRIVELEATATDAAGVCIARASARFLRVGTL
jgi:acyl-coenzyme A thioesterase PaaI-like protein